MQMDIARLYWILHLSIVISVATAQQVINFTRIKEEVKPLVDAIPNLDLIEQQAGQLKRYIEMIVWGCTAFLWICAYCATRSRLPSKPRKKVA
jgi:hypothetical protein